MTERQHKEKLFRISLLMDSPDTRELEKLTAEVSEYEKKLFPIDPPTLAMAMKFRREQMGETIEQIANRAQISVRLWGLLESGHTDWSMDMARKLYAVGIPANVLLS